MGVVWDMRFGVTIFLLAVLSSPTFAHTYCDYTQRLAVISWEKREDYGERSLIPKAELKRLIDGFPGDTPAEKYRGARDYVASLPFGPSLRLSVILKSFLLYDLLTEISRRSDPLKPWEFEQYFLGDGSHVFEGGGLYRPVLIIRLSDGAMFTGMRPESTSRASWKPDFETELTPVGK